MDICYRLYKKSRFWLPTHGAHFFFFPVWALGLWWAHSGAELTFYGRDPEIVISDSDLTQLTVPIGWRKVLNTTDYNTDADIVLATTINGAMVLVISDPKEDIPHIRNLKAYTELRYESLGNRSRVSSELYFIAL